MGKKKLVPYVGLPSGISPKKKGKSPEIVYCDISGFLTRIYKDNMTLSQECARLQERLDACSKIQGESGESNDILSAEVKEADDA